MGFFGRGDTNISCWVSGSSLRGTCQSLPAPGSRRLNCGPCATRFSGTVAHGSELWSPNRGTGFVVLVVVRDGGCERMDGSQISQIGRRDCGPSPPPKKNDSGEAKARLDR